MTATPELDPPITAWRVERHGTGQLVVEFCWHDAWWQVGRWSHRFPPHRSGWRAVYEPRPLPGPVALDLAREIVALKRRAARRRP